MEKKIEQSCFFLKMSFSKFWSVVQNILIPKTSSGHREVLHDGDVR